MNILFANYGDFSSNSLNHIGTFAAGLAELGHACMVAVPWGLETLHVVHQPRFTPALFADVLAGTVGFPDGRHADIVHAWTPREAVRRFVLAYERLAHARVVVHLEDNEDHLFAARHGLETDALLDLAEDRLASLVDDVLIHPRRARLFVRACDGATVIVPTLARLLPADLPYVTLHPALDPTLFEKLPSRAEARRSLGLESDARIVSYPGGSNFANEAELRDLYAAVALLNERGCPVTLLRTGRDSDVFDGSLPDSHRAHVVHLGFVAKDRIPLVLAAADVLVQPGEPGPYNDMRLPSKVPEFLASGRPVVLPASNIATSLRHGVDAWIVADSRPETLANACEHLLRSPELAASLGAHAVEFARAHFDLRRQCALLAGCYADVLRTAPRPGSLAGVNTDESQISLSLRSLAAKLVDLPGARSAATQLTEAIPLIEQLERPKAAALERDRALRERDSWRAHFDAAKAHTGNVEAQLAAATRHAENVEKQRSATEVHARNLQAVAKNLQGQIDAADARAAALEAEKHALEAARDTALGQVEQLSERAARLSGTIHELKLELIRRNAKIATLEASLSWRLTMPLRWLRRKLLDPRRRAASADAVAVLPEIAPPAPPCSPPGLYGLPHSVDEPRGWTLAPRKHLVRGWVFHPDGNELRGVRAVIGARAVEGVYGFKRLDVAASVRGKPQAEFCGWRIDVEFEERDTSMELQALEESGLWLPFFRTDLRVGHDLGPTDLSRYEEWLKVYDSLSAETLHAQRERFAAAAHPVVISVVMPVFNTPARWLHRAIESVRAQTYPHWELCIANDASDQAHVRAILDAAAAGDARIKVVHRATNGHISAASNSALGLATGSFIALLDHDDELAPHALHEVAIALERRPDADLVYSDEDKIDEDGRRFEPYFKPDWNPDLFLGQNYLSHLSVYRAARVREVGGFREGFEGSQDWDLALRVTDSVAADRILHVPRVLYHWRAIAGSTALQLSEKGYPVEAARRALLDHFRRTGENVRLEPVAGDHWRVIHPLPEPPPLVSIVIPTRNSLEHVRLCVESILEKTDYPAYEILIVDNQSDDPATLAWFGSIASDRVRVLSYPHRFNYSAINNSAVREARGSVVALLNNDLEVINAGWLTEMVSQACREGVGCVGAMLYYPNDVIQHAGVVLGVGGVAGHAFRDFPRGTEGVFNRARLVQDYSAVTAACLVVRKSVYEQVGGLDEVDLAVAFNDIDFCLKVRAAGFRNVWTPFAELYHHESASRGADDTPEKKTRFEREIEIMLRRWGGELTDDPAYNPNLTLERNDFTLAVPPRPPRLPGAQPPKLAKRSESTLAAAHP